VGNDSEIDLCSPWLDIVVSEVSLKQNIVTEKYHSCGNEIACSAEFLKTPEVCIADADPLQLDCELENNIWNPRRDGLGVRFINNFAWHL
jgi:hypothetical protein